MATTLKSYTERTKGFRGSILKLFISFKKSYRAVFTQTLSRWIRSIMSQSGVDISIFTAYSTRHAATSAAKRKDNKKDNGFDEGF